jgi:hypothetical protein
MICEKYIFVQLFEAKRSRKFKAYKGIPDMSAKNEMG